MRRRDQAQSDLPLGLDVPAEIARDIKVSRLPSVIQTTYEPPPKGSRRPGRVWACSAHSAFAYLDCRRATPAPDDHMGAARKLVVDLGWSGQWAGMAWSTGGYVFIMLGAADLVTLAVE